MISLIDWVVFGHAHPSERLSFGGRVERKSYIEGNVKRVEGILKKGKGDSSMRLL